jgi:hypothetical protein
MQRNSAENQEPGGTEDSGQILDCPASVAVRFAVSCHPKLQVTMAVFLLFQF